MIHKLAAILVAVLFVAGLVGGGTFLAEGGASVQTVEPAKANGPAGGGCC